MQIGHRCLLFLCLLAVLVSPSPAEITTSVSWDDPTGALGDDVRPLIESHIQAAGTLWGRFLAGDAAIEVIVRSSTGIPYAEGTSVTSNFVRNNGVFNVFEQGMTAELRTGADPNGATPDVRIDINPGYVYDELWFDPDPLARTAPTDNLRTDAMSTFLHEFGHALGFAGWIDPQTGQYPGDYQSTYDELTVFDGQNFFSTGPRSSALYGGPVPLTFANTSHLANFSPRPGEDMLLDLMNGLVFYRGYRYVISEMDLALLEDAGVPIVRQAGDYRLDGIVDAADLAEWSTDFGGVSPAGFGSDGNGDGMIDAADYTVWRDNLGAGLGPASGPSPDGSVPEPAAWLVFALGATVVLSRRA